MVRLRLFNSCSRKGVCFDNCDVMKACVLGYEIIIDVENTSAYTHIDTHITISG